MVVFKLIVSCGPSEDLQLQLRTRLSPILYTSWEYHGIDKS